MEDDRARTGAIVRAPLATEACRKKLLSLQIESFGFKSRYEIFQRRDNQLRFDNLRAHVYGFVPVVAREPRVQGVEGVYKLTFRLLGSQCGSDDLFSGQSLVLGANRIGS